MEGLNIQLVKQKKSGSWLAKELKVTKTTVSSWRNDRHMPSKDMLRKIADLLNVEIKDLF